MYLSVSIHPSIHLYAYPPLQTQTKFEVSDQDAKLFLAVKQNELEKVQQLCESEGIVTMVGR